MKDTVLLRLGRFGDIISSLPLLYHLNSTGSRPTLAVSNAYSCVGDYCSYFDSEIFGASFEDCIRVKAKLKGRYRTILDGSVYGNNFDFTRQAPHFVHESYLRCGYGREYAAGQFHVPIFDKIPEWKWRPIADTYIKQGVKNVALSMNGNSSPLPGVDGYRESITKALQAEGANVIDVSYLRLPCVVDLLAIFRECDLVITSDTSTAHLIKAQGPTPYILMKNDLFGNRDTWYAATPGHNCIVSYWYSEMPTRINNLIAQSIKQITK